MDDAAKQVYIAALIRERQEYVAAGFEDRVAEVDAELARVGADGKPKTQRREKRIQKPTEQR